MTPLDEAAARQALAEAKADGVDGVAIAFMHGYKNPAHEARVAALAAESGLRPDLGQPPGLAADEAGLAWRHHRRRRLPEPDPAALRRTGARAARRRPRRLPPSHVHAVERRTHRRPAVPGQGCDPLRPRRRRGRDGEDRGACRLRPADRLRHGRHLDRRLPLCRRLRAQLRDRGRRGAHARADDEHPHRRRRRRLDPEFPGRPLPGRAGLRWRQPRAGLLPPRRSAHGDRLQRHARQAERRPFPARFRPDADQPLDSEVVADQSSPRSPRRLPPRPAIR